MVEVSIWVRLAKSLEDLHILYWCLIFVLWHLEVYTSLSSKQNFIKFLLTVQLGCLININRIPYTEPLRHLKSSHSMPLNPNVVLVKIHRQEILFILGQILLRVFWSKEMWYFWAGSGLKGGGGKPLQQETLFFADVLSHMKIPSAVVWGGWI